MQVFAASGHVSAFCGTSTPRSQRLATASTAFVLNLLEWSRPLEAYSPHTLFLGRILIRLARTLQQLPVSGGTCTKRAAMRFFPFQSEAHVASWVNLRAPPMMPKRTARPFGRLDSVNTQGHKPASINLDDGIQDFSRQTIPFECPPAGMGPRWSVSWTEMKCGSSQGLESSPQRCSPLQPAPHARTWPQLAALQLWSSKPMAVKCTGEGR